uniref:Putative secreted protein n=1 Tax=Amblyomma parvum TaxID=251391 RepID=A0A023G262_AMBPA
MCSTARSLCVLYLIMASQCLNPPRPEGVNAPKHSYRANRPQRVARRSPVEPRKCPVRCNPEQGPGESCGPPGCICSFLPGRNYQRGLPCVSVLSG